MSLTLKGSLKPGEADRRYYMTVGDIKLVQEWLGHTSIMTTARTYAHVQTHRMVDAAAMLTAARHLNSE